MANTIRALSEMGKVDLFCFYDARQAQESVPPEFGISRICMVPLGPSGDTPARRLVSLARRDLPLEVAFRNGNQNPRHVFDSWRASSYDLVWLSSATSYQWLGRPRLGPTVVDVCDLADVKERQRADLLGKRPAHDAVARLRRAAAVAQARINAADWSRFQRSVASEVDRVVLASETDVPLFGVENCDVVPNTYERPDHPAGHDVPLPSAHTAPSGDLRLRAERRRCPLAGGGVGACHPDEAPGPSDPNRREDHGERRHPRRTTPRHRGGKGPADGARTGQSRPGGRSAADGKRDETEDPRGLRPPGTGRVDAARRRRPCGSRRRPSCSGRSTRVVRRGLREALQRSRLPPSARRRSPGLVRGALRVEGGAGSDPRGRRVAHDIRSNRISVNSPAGRRMIRSSCRVSGWSDVSNPQ